MSENFPEAALPPAQGDTARLISQHEVNFELHAGSCQEQGVGHTGVATNREDLQLFGVTYGGIDKGYPGVGARASARVAESIEARFDRLKASLPEGPRTIGEAEGVMGEAFVDARRSLGDREVGGGTATATYGLILGNEGGDPKLILGHTGSGRISIVRQGLVYDLINGKGHESDHTVSLKAVSDPEEAAQKDIIDSGHLEYGDRVVIFNDDSQQELTPDEEMALRLSDPGAAAQTLVEAGRHSAVVIDVLPLGAVRQQQPATTPNPFPRSQSHTAPTSPRTATAPASGNTGNNNGNSGNLPPTPPSPERAEDEPEHDILYWPRYPEGSSQDEAYALHTLAKRNREYVDGNIATADRSNDHLSAGEKARLAHYFNPDQNGRHRSQYGRLLTAAETAEVTMGKIARDDNGAPLMRIAKDPNGRDLYDNVPGGIAPRVEGFIVHDLEEDDPPYNETPPPPVEISREVYEACEALDELYLAAEAKRALPAKIHAIDSVSLRDGAQKRAERHSLNADYDARPWTVLMGGDPLAAHLVYKDRELAYLVEQVAHKVVNGRLKGRVVVR